MRTMLTDASVQRSAPELKPISLIHVNGQKGCRAVGLVRQEVTKRAEVLVATVLNAASSSTGETASALSRISTAAYLTDADGWITAFNDACIPLAGRTPKLGVDRWCVTWRLRSSDGKPLPHDRCPMAVALQQKRPVRGIEAIVERPDGSRIPMLPFPTPLFDSEGTMLGAVNLLVDVSMDDDLKHLSAQVERCRRLASSIDDASTAETLRQLASEYEAQARDLLDLA